MRLTPRSLAVSVQPRRCVQPSPKRRHVRRCLMSLLRHCDQQLPSCRSHPTHPTHPTHRWLRSRPMRHRSHSRRHPSRPNRRSECHHNAVTAEPSPPGSSRAPIALRSPYQRRSRRSRTCCSPCSKARSACQTPRAQDNACPWGAAACTLLRFQSHTCWSPCWRSMVAVRWAEALPLGWAGKSSCRRSPPSCRRRLHRCRPAARDRPSRRRPSLCRLSEVVASTSSYCRTPNRAKCSVPKPPARSFLSSCCKPHLESLRTLSAHDYHESPPCGSPRWACVYHALHPRAATCRH